MTKKAATIYLRHHKYYVDSDWKTVAGFWICSGHVQVAEEGDVKGIATALRLALDSSKDGVPTPGPDKDLAGPLLSAARVRTWRTFAREATYVGATLEDGLVTLTPGQKADTAGNYVPLSEKVRTVRYASDDLGQAVIEAFNDAE